MFITYKIVNDVTGEYYIGSHKTDDPNDDYMGSGKLIKESINKYGVENHHKEIIATFDNRKDSTDLEHKLIKEKKAKKDNLILNASTGGSSFDWINENLTLDYSAIGKLASHEYWKQLKLDNIDNYNKSPKCCLTCGKPIDYERRENKFCCRSCAAKYNNSHRDYHPSKNKTIHTGICRYCKNEFIKNHNAQMFCSNKCRGLFQKAEGTELQKTLKDDLEIIQKLHETKSLREIAKMYNTSANTLSMLLRGLL